MITQVHPKALIGGAISFIPGVYSAVQSFKSAQRRGGGSTGKAAYCYTTWLRHLLTLHKAGMTFIPDSVCELGPGATIGVGLSALLCGASRSISLDVDNYFEQEANLRLFEQLVPLFVERADLDQGGPLSDSNANASCLFPEQILPPSRMEECLAPARISAIEQALRNPGEICEGIQINYHAPYDTKDILEESSCDLILSNAVLEHVTEPSDVYANLNRWIKPTGWLSHQIDFRCHGATKDWNGHWSLHKQVWALVVGKRPYLINRQPLSFHLDELKRHGFSIALCNKQITEEGIERSALSEDWKWISDEDLSCLGAYIAAQPSKTLPSKK